MKLSISGIHMETSPALREHTETRMESITKYFDQVIEANVAFIQEPHQRNVHGAEVTVYASGVMLRAEGAGPDWHAALDEAVAKLGRQLERYKGRLMKHREKRQKFQEKLKLNGAQTMDGLSFESAMVDNSRFDDDDTGPDGLAAGFRDGKAEGVALDGIDRAMLEDFAPAVVRKDVSRVAPMTVDEAIMQMDLLHQPAFLFLNETSGKLNMVYREGENNVRWVAPKEIG